MMKAAFVRKKCYAMKGFPAEPYPVVGTLVERPRPTRNLIRL